MDEYYNRTARGYNDLYGQEQRKKLDMIKKYYKPNRNQKLLDVGCGTGISSNWDCEVIGVDPNMELLKQSNNKILCGGENLPFPDNSFDCVVCLTAIHNFSDPFKGIDEIKRVTNGKAIISILIKSKRFNEIINKIKAEFAIEKEIDEEKDKILILNSIT